MVWYRFLSQALAEALKVNTTVKNIHLSWNRIGSEGTVAWLHLVALEKKTISIEFAWYLYGICLSLQVADCTPSFCHLGVLLPSHVRDSWKILPNSWITCPTPLMSYKSQTSIVHIVPIGSMYGIFTYVYYKDQPNVGKYIYHTWILLGTQWFHFHYMIFQNVEPQTAKHQVCSFLADAISRQVDVHLVDFQCFGMGLRADKDGKPFQAWEFATPCPTPNIWSQEITSRSQCEWVAHLSWCLQMIFQLVGY